MRRRLAVLGLALLAACGGVDMQHQTTARPVHAARAPQVNGAIFQDGVSYRPLFEDRRARYVGDTLIVTINEKTAASKSADGSASRGASVAFAVPKVQELPLKSFQDAALDATASSKLESKEAATANNLFTGSVAVTVVEQLANGNLVVAGEKQIGINGDIETLRFSGVVNPMHITAGNIVTSTSIADARIEVSSKSTVKPEQVIGFLGRFFLSFLPFR